MRSADAKCECKRKTVNRAICMTGDGQKMSGDDGKNEGADRDERKGGGGRTV